MKAVVIYKSKTGFAKTYAQWIAEELSADIFEASKATISMLDGYDTIIYGGGVYAGNINGIKFITNNISKLAGKKIVVYATGLSVFKEEIVANLKKNNIKPNVEEHIKFFYLQGGFDYTKLGFSDKIIMGMLKRRLKRKKEENKTNSDRGTLASFEKPIDNTSKDKISELIAYVNS